MSSVSGIIEQAFGRFIKDRQPTGSVAKLAQLLASGCSSASEIEAVARDYAFSREDLLDLLVYFLESCFSNHSLDESKKSGLRKLKRLFRVKEGELYGLRERKVRDLLQQEIDGILGDGTVDPEGALYLVDLQEAFDLSYDQFLEVTRSSFDRVVEEITEQIEAHGQATAEEQRLFFERILGLGIFYKITERQRLLLFGQVPTGDQPTSSAVG